MGYTSDYKILSDTHRFVFQQHQSFIPLFFFCDSCLCVFYQGFISVHRTQSAGKSRQKLPITYIIINGKGYFKYVIQKRFDRKFNRSPGYPGGKRSDPRDRSLEENPEEQVVDLQHKLVLPPFIESHVHLDTCLTAGDPVWNMSGTLFEGIECWSKRKEKLNEEDITERVNKVVRMYAANGIQYIRTHIDVTDPSLMAMKTMIKLREELKNVMEIQIVAFPQEGILSYPDGKKLLTEAVDMGADVIGAIPHFEFTREYSVESLDFALNLAAERDKLVDVHCDEIDDEASRGLETVAARALELGLFDKVTASHTTAMHSYNNAYVLRLMRLLRMSKINFVSNPLVNTHLQGRIDTYPKRRGVTRVKELLSEGINVSFGHDDIFDPWYPMGNGSLRDVVFLGLHVCQMMGYQEIMDSYKLITHNAARTLHISDRYGIEMNKPASFIVLDARNYYEALTRDSVVLYSYKNGEKIAENSPSVNKMFF